MAKIITGIDIGGTSIKAGLFDEHLELLHNCVPVKTAPLASGDELVEQVLASIKAGISKLGGQLSDLVGIGIGSPGPLDLQTGVIIESPNTQILNAFPLRDKVSDAAGVPVWLDNDANVFVLGEAQQGVGKGYPYVLGVTLGTGFGWGFVMNGKVYHGATGTAMEYGPTVWNKEGHTWEDDVSIGGLMRVYREIGGTVDTPEKVSKQAAKGDDKALAAWHEYGRVLGLSLSHSVNMLDPNVIVVGGAMAKAWEHFSATMLETLRRNIFTKPRENLKVMPSQLGNLAALYGAASQVHIASG